MPKYGSKRDPEAELRILDAAETLVCERGPGAVSINEIAATAGVGKQTIYRWWASKNALLIDALEHRFARQNPAPNRATTKENLRTQMRRAARTFSSPTGAIIRELVAASQSDPSLAEDFRNRVLHGRRSRARKVVEDGIANGELRPDIEVEAAIDLLYAPLWTRLLFGRRPPTRRAADQILELAWPALAKPSHSSTAHTDQAKQLETQNC